MKRIICRKKKLRWRLYEKHFFKFKRIVHTHTLSCLPARSNFTTPVASAKSVSSLPITDIDAGMKFCAALSYEDIAGEYLPDRQSV